METLDYLTIGFPYRSDDFPMLSSLGLVQEGETGSAYGGPVCELEVFDLFKGFETIASWWHTGEGLEQVPVAWVGMREGFVQVSQGTLQYAAIRALPHWVRGGTALSLVDAHPFLTKVLVPRLRLFDSNLDKIKQVSRWIRGGPWPDWALVNMQEMHGNCVKCVVKRYPWFESFAEVFTSEIGLEHTRELYRFATLTETQQLSRQGIEVEFAWSLLLSIQSVRRNKGGAWVYRKWKYGKCIC